MDQDTPVDDVSVQMSTPTGPRRALPTPPKEPRRGQNRVLVIILSVALLGVLGGIAWLLVPRLLPHTDSPGVAYSAEGAVRGYLESLASGDATTALLYSATQPEDPKFASNAFVTASMAANPITDVQVPDGQATTSPAQIHATYTLGGQPVRAHFSVQKYGNRWLLDGGVLPLNLSQLTDKGVPLTLNGVRLGATDKVYLLPGIYNFATLNPMLALTNPTFTIEYPESDPTFSEAFTLSDDGIAKIRAAAKAKLDSCLHEQSLRPEGCGFGVQDPAGDTIDTTSIAWTLADGAPDMASISPSLDGSSLTLAWATIAISVKFHAISTDKAHLYDSPSTISAVRADFTDPDHIAVTFGH